MLSEKEKRLIRLADTAQAGEALKAVLENDHVKGFFLLMESSTMDALQDRLLKGEDVTGAACMLVALKEFKERMAGNIASSEYARRTLNELAQEEAQNNE